MFTSATHIDIHDFYKEKKISLLFKNALDFSKYRTFNSLFKLKRITMVKLGKCPECKTDLDDSEVDDIHFKGTINRHIAYRCRKCDAIIGFSAYNTLS